MLDFTSSQYLGFWHASRSLRPWTRLTTGVPAALREAADAKSIAADLAALQGLAQATLARSTLHLFWDLFGMLPAERYCIYVDAQAYPILHWGAEQAAGRGVIVKTFSHRDADSLHSLLHRQKKQLRPVILTNGVCISCGSTTPLQAYQACIEKFGGLMIVDDTQALGIFGHFPTSEQPYGLGGGGSLRYLGLSGDSVLVICSLAKAFGAPIASLSGSRSWIQRYETLSRTRVHCSPPSLADLRAAEQALYLNKSRGEVRRNMLLEHVQLFKAMLADIGLSSTGGIFPVQTLRNEGVVNLSRIHQKLREQGVETVLHRVSPGKEIGLSFILTAGHLPTEIQAAVEYLSLAVYGDRTVSTEVLKNKQDTWRRSEATI